MPVRPFNGKGTDDAPDLHGRYLLVVYLPAFAVGCSLLAAPRFDRAVMPLIAAVHAFSLSTILLRYF